MSLPDDVQLHDVQPGFREVGGEQWTSMAQCSRDRSSMPRGTSDPRFGKPIVGFNMVAKQDFIQVNLEAVLSGEQKTFKIMALGEHELSELHRNMEARFQATPTSFVQAH